MSRRTPVPVVLAVVLVLALAGCGGGPPDPGGLTGRVMAKTEDRGYCVSPDRGETQRCVPLAQADEEVEVGECVRITNGPTPEAHRLAAVDESDCAAGDLGDEAPSG